MRDPASATYRVFRELTRLLGIRAMQPAFHPDAAQQVVRTDPRVFALIRRQRTPPRRSTAPAIFLRNASTCVSPMLSQGLPCPPRPSTWSGRNRSTSPTDPSRSRPTRPCGSRQGGDKRGMRFYLTRVRPEAAGYCQPALAESGLSLLRRDPCGSRDRPASFRGVRTDIKPDRELRPQKASRPAGVGFRRPNGHQAERPTRGLRSICTQSRRGCTGISHGFAPGRRVIGPATRIKVAFCIGYAR